MGRYDLRPLRVHDLAALTIKTRPNTTIPPWFEAIKNYPPTQTFVRTQPIQHKERAPLRKARRASKIFKPQTIHYEEDSLRHTFFADHPWELARPRIMVEEDGQDHTRYDWSKPLNQTDGRPLNGESVVQRQMWLMKNSHELHASTKRRNTMAEQAALLAQEKPTLLEVPPIMSRAAAYDKARKEFYEQRHFDQVEQLVAKEEALSTGAYFGKTANEVGMQLEDREFDKWRAFANERVTLAEQRRSAGYTGGDAPDSPASEDTNSLDNVVDKMEEMTTSS